MNKLKPFLRWSLVGVVVLFVGHFAAAPSQAATLTFALTSDHCTGGCLTGQSDGGTITITDIGGNVVSVNVTLSNNNKFVSTGFQTDFGFNLIGNPAITYSGVTSGFTPTGSNPQNAGSLMMDGTGQFEYGVSCSACGNGGSNPQNGPLNFTITAAGLSTASFQANASNQFFALDLLSGTTGRTGAVDASPTNTPTVPEPSTLALCGLGLALVTVGQTWRKKQARV